MATAFTDEGEALRPTRGLFHRTRRVAAAGGRRLTIRLGGPARTRVIVLLACVLALASADTATVGASATELRRAMHISNTDVGLLVAVTSLVGAIASVPFGLLADRFNRTRMLTFSVTLWGVAMVGSATAANFKTLLLWRVALGFVTAASGPPVASLVGDYFPSSERGVIYSYILSGELLGAGVGFTVTGDVSSLSWRAAFVLLGLATFPLAWALSRLREPARGGANPIVAEGPEDAAGPYEASDATHGPPAAAESGVGPVADAPPGDQPLIEPPPAAWTSTPPARAEAGSAGEAGADTEVTDAQRLAASAGIAPDRTLMAKVRGRRLGLFAAARYVLSVKTNVALILSSACGYYFLAGVQTFGVEFVRGHYHVGAALANLLMIAIGAGAVVGVVTAGPLSDRMLHRGRIHARVLVPAVAVTITTVLFVPALLTRDVLTALPYVIVAAMALSAQNPPIDAARLDIMPFQLWGRAEGIRTFVRTMAQSLAPILFGSLSDLIGLRDTFLIMLLPLAASAFFLFRATRCYPSDVATAVTVAQDLSAREASPNPSRAEPHAT